MDSDPSSGPADADPIQDRPLLAGVLVLVVATAAWVGISLTLGDGVDPLQTAIFAVAFTVVYVGFSIYTG